MVKASDHFSEPFLFTCLRFWNEHSFGFHADIPITTRPILGVCEGFGVGLGVGIAIAPIRGSYFGVGLAIGIGKREPRSTFREKAATIERPARKLTIKDNAAVAIIEARCFTFAHPTGQSCVRIVPSARR